MLSSEMALLLATEFSDKGWFWIIGGSVAIVALAGSAIKSVLSTRARERTKREIAAYVAEGTIDPDKAIAMLKAGEDADGCA